MDSPKKQASKILRDKKMYQRWLAIFMCLALVVTSGTVTALKLTGQAMTAKQLQCSYVPHEHTDECYNDEGELICGLSDKVVHTHDSSCYDAEGNIVCTLEELEPHEHDDSCYTEVKELICGQQEHEAIPAHHHTEKCYTTETADEQVLTCGLEETDGVPAVEAAPGHVHTDACYTTKTVEVTPAGVDEEGNEIPAVTEEQRTLTCGMAEGEGAVEGQPEIPAHHHTEECYTTQTTETQVLTCGLEEHDEEIPAHHHTDECYTTSTELTCGKDEVILHVHTDDCYEIVVDEETGEEISRTLTCTQPQLEAHQHGDECFVEVAVDEIVPSEQPEEELPTASVVYCGKDAHTHTDECYQQDENGEFVLDENGEKILICELEEHVHTEECYVEPEATEPEDERELICGKEEHTHTDECYLRDENGEFILDENGEKILTCELEEHTHTEECYAQPEQEPELLTATKTVGDVTVTVEYSEDANFPEGTELDFYEYDKDSEEYAQYAEQVEGEMDRLFNIGFYLNGEEVEPAEGAIVKVNVTYPGMEEKRQRVTHFTDEGPVALGAQTTTDGENTTVEFYTDSFSPIGFSTLADGDNVYVLKVTETQDIRASDGSDGEWTSSNSSVVSVEGNRYYSRSATITAKSASNDPVTITFNGTVQVLDHYEYVETLLGLWPRPIYREEKFTESYTVYVVPEIEISGLDQCNAKTQTPITLTATGIPEGAKDVTWKVSNGNASITGNGTTASVVGEKVGTVNVTVSYSYHGRTVTSDPFGVTVVSQSAAAEAKGTLNVQKYIEKDYGDGTYDLSMTFNATKGSKNNPALVDVIFVVDTSGSMDETFGSKTREEAAYDAVLKAIDIFEKSQDQGTVDAQYAVVTFAKNATRKEDWRSVTKDPDTKVTFGSNEGTNYGAGLHAASKLVNESYAARPNAERIVIFISDGQPTYGYEYQSWEGGFYKVTGEGTDYKDDYLTDAQKQVTAMSESINRFYTIFVGNENDTFEYGSGWIKKERTYKSVMEDLTSAANKITNGYYPASDTTALDNALEEIAGSSVDVYFTNAKLTDYLQDYIKLAPVSVSNKPTDLIVTVLDADGNTVASGVNSVTFDDGDKKGITFTASYNETAKKIEANLPPDYALNPSYTYKVTARIKLDETWKGDLVVEENGSVNDGVFATLPSGVRTNKNTNDIVSGEFGNESAEKPLPPPVLPLSRTLTIKKVDGESNEKLPGAVFTLKQAGMEDKTFTTDENGVAVITGIQEGSYTLAETKAPDGYNTPDENDVLTIRVNKDCTVSISSNGTEESIWPVSAQDMTMGAKQTNIELVVKNETSGVPVQIIKQGVSGVSLKDAKFEISSNPNEAYLIKSTDGGPETIFDGNLPVGTVVDITEILPDGSKYQQIKPVRVMIEKDESSTENGGYKVTFVDEAGKALGDDYTVASRVYDAKNNKWIITIKNTLAPLSGVTIFKVAAATNNQPLQGAEFTLYQQDSKGSKTLTLNAKSDDPKTVPVTEIRAGLTTDKDGKVVIQTADNKPIEFVAGETYYLVETKAPDGYTAGSEPITVTVKVDEKTGDVVLSASAQATDSENNASVVDGKIIRITNNPGVEMPHTGGMGTRMFTVGGGLLMVLAAGLYFWNKRRISEM